MMLLPAARILALLGTLAVASTAVAAEESEDGTDAVTATLVTESSTVMPGGSVRLGLRLQHAPHWHTYWRNPGDSGLATRVRWTLPPGYTAEDISWPAPTRFDVGGLYNIGYIGDTLLTVRLHVPADAKPGDSAAIGAEASWLMCREQCIPGKASLRLTLPVTGEVAVPDKTHAPLFAQATAMLPTDAQWQAQAHLGGASLVVTLRGSALPRCDGLDAFVEERKLVGYAPPRISASENLLTLEFPKSDYFTAAPAQLNLLLVCSAGAPRAWHAIAPLRIP